MARPNNWYFWFYLQKKSKFEPLYISNEQTFWKTKKKNCFELRVLELYHKNFKHLPWVESKEVARPIICGFDTQKSHFVRVFFAVFSGTAHELMVPAKRPNAHPRPHLMPKESTDLLNSSRRWTISGVQNGTLYYKIDKVIQLLWWLYKWSLAHGLYKTLDNLFLFQIEPEI